MAEDGPDDDGPDDDGPDNDGPVNDIEFNIIWATDPDKVLINYMYFLEIRLTKGNSKEKKNANAFAK